MVSGKAIQYNANIFWNFTEKIWHARANNFTQRLQKVFGFYQKEDGFRLDFIDAKHDNMGQVMKIQLSCYLVLLSVDTKTK